MKKYEISLNGYSDCCCSSAVRFLTPRQAEHLEELFDELNSGQSTSDYAPCIGISEIKVRLYKAKNKAGTVVAYLENAEDLSVGQTISYLWNKKSTRFKVVDIGKEKYLGKYVPVIMSPNDKVALIPFNSTFETDYK